MRRITLTEEQMRYIIAGSIVDSAYLNESVMGDIGNGLVKAGKAAGKFASNVGRGAYQFTRDKVMRDFKSCKTIQDYIKMLAWYVSIGYFTIVGAHATLNKVFPNQAQEIIQQFDEELESLSQEEEQGEDANFDEEQEKIHQQKVEEVNRLMQHVAQLNGRLNLLKLSAENIVSQCEKYDYPLPLLLAQAHVESHFGTTPRAQRTNSVFSVGSYDNGKNACVFNSQDESVEHYIKTMQNNYLNNKSVDDLLTPGNFVNGIGKRYASNKRYEQEVKATMNGLIKKYCPTCFD